MRGLRAAIRTGLTDLRGDLGRFVVLIACLALGTGIIAAVGSVGTSLRTAAESEASLILGGDLELVRTDRDATPTERALIAELGASVHVVEANARATAETADALVDLLAVGPEYPLRGAVVIPELAPGTLPADLLAERDGTFGAVVDGVLLDQLDIALGGQFRIGDADFEVRGTLDQLPDEAIRGFRLGLTAMVSDAALVAISDLTSPLPGLLTNYRYKVVLDGTSFEDAAATVRSEMGAETWTIRSPRDAIGPFIVFFDLFSRFLLIVGLTSLLIGGVGVSNAVTAYIAERQSTIAILRSLGADRGRVTVHFLTQIGVLALIGVAIGVAAGAAASALVLPAIGAAINVPVAPSIETGALLGAAGFGLLTAFTFSYLPLARAQRISPVLLFRSVGLTMPGLTWRQIGQVSVFLPIAIAVLGMLGLGVLITGDAGLVLAFAVAGVVALVLLRVVIWAFQALLRALPAQSNARLRTALRNIYGIGSGAPTVIVSVGLGLTMLLVIVLLSHNLQAQLLGTAFRDAPSFVALDLFEDEVEQLTALQAGRGDIERVTARPMLRAGVAGINGAAPETLSPQTPEGEFLLSGNIPMTWLEELPEHSRIVAGSWWAADYDGPPLVSLHADLQSDLGLSVGDTFEVSLFGETIAAEIANFRDYQWQNGIEFVVAFSPGLIEGYPATLFATVNTVPGAEGVVERALAAEFPFVRFVPVGNALDQLAGALTQLSTAVATIGGIAVINGLLVLVGTLASGRKQRELDAVIQKVLGATRADVLGTYLLEYLLLGLVAAAIALVLGVGITWAITLTALDVDFSLAPMTMAAVTIGVIVLTIVTGAIATWQLLSTRPAPYLREKT
jgi:putative ABC transport system permease protein